MTEKGNWTDSPTCPHCEVKVAGAAMTPTDIDMGLYYHPVCLTLYCAVGFCNYSIYLEYRRNDDTAQ